MVSPLMSVTTQINYADLLKYTIYLNNILLNSSGDITLPLTTIFQIK